MIFARELSGPVASLVKKIDAATAQNADAKMCSFAVFCSDSDGLEKQLKQFADKEKLSRCILTIDNPAGPRGYKIAKDADVTVILYVKKKVQANHAFKKGELNDQAIEKILADLPKITAKK